MKKRFVLFLAAVLVIMLCGCTPEKEYAPVVTTTLTVHDFTSRICQGTDIPVARLITENVSCLHDYSLNVSQVRAAEAAEVVIISGAGLEEFMSDLLVDKDVIDCSENVHIHEAGNSHTHDHHDDHHHESDSHIWLSPENAKIMAQNICAGLSQQYPRYAKQFESNLSSLLADLGALESYGNDALANLSCRELITFHDGFGYLAESFDLHILEAIEEESGSEASAGELKHLITLVRDQKLPAVFVERNGSDSAAAIISRETGTKICTLDMAMTGNSYFDAMYHNIDTLKEALE